MGEKKRLVKIGVTVSLLIVTALACRYLGYLPNAFFSKLLNFVRTLIYIGIISVWGVSVNRRVVQTQVRILLNCVTLIMVFWLTVREFKFRFVDNPTVIRYLWYSYYIPILLIPLLALLVSFSLGKSEKYRLPKPTLLLFIPTGILILLVMTNDLHEKMFIFPENVPIRTEADYTYGTVFFVAVAWVLVLSLISLVNMRIKSRSTKSAFLRWLPIVPIVVAALNTVLYTSRIPYIRFVTGDIAVLFCLAITGFFEGCIQGGLIQTNTRYYDLFTSSREISAQIVDNNYNVVFSASDASPVKKEDMISAADKSVILPGGRLLHTLKVDGGTAVWSEDVSTLLSLRETLEDRKEELEERRNLLELEYEREKENKTVEEQNRLYDLLQNRTQSQLDSINALVSDYRKADDEERKHKILSKIVILGSFIKRRKDFALSFDYSENISESMLESALGESFRALRLLEIKGEYLVDTRSRASGEQLSEAYDFFECVIETALDGLHYVNVRVCLVKDNIRVSILTDYSGNVNKVRAKYPLAKIEQPDSDGYSFVLEMKGGEVK